MPAYEARSRWSSTVDGRLYSCAAGDVIDWPTPVLVAALRDAPGLLDPEQPLTAERVAELRRRQAERDAEADQAAHVDHDRHTAITRHVRTHGAVCPGDGTATPLTVPRPTAGIPHPVTGADLDAARVGEVWAVACPGCLPRIVAAQTLPPALPERPDPTPRRYLVQHRYGSTYTEYEPYGPPQLSVPEAERGRVLTFTAGQEVQLPAHIAEWVNRDSPRTLTPQE